jgi:hypothetical protein
VPLDELLGEADVVVVACPLTDETRGLDRRRLGLMKPTAFLVNVARGAIVDQATLIDALRERRWQAPGSTSSIPSLCRSTTRCSRRPTSSARRTRSATPTSCCADASSRPASR